jgi:transcriptional regulator with XRE-family HTH domain
MQRLLRIKALRQVAGLSAFEVAGKARISSGRYSYLERGLLRPTPEERERLGEIFGVPGSSLFRGIVLRPRQKEREPVPA